ncbi:hypothetical protein ACYSNR_09670 [Enterococcus sp. LJL128]|uniref:hypothetical protein n=1 Tax=Enterococcus sp. LJL51 TaxID=3416656 RepID=UPI003CF3199E
MNNKSLVVNVLTLIGLFFAAGIILSMVMGIVGSLLWFAIKILIPVAVIVWLVRLVSGNSGNNRRYYR